MGYLFDSKKSLKEPLDYRITHVFEKAIKQKTTWDKVDLVNKTRMVRQSEINEFVERTLKVFISSFRHDEDE
ncbi:hypothetical protein Hanom_Chr07g00600181 [Helianthus anomalus]